MEIRLARTEDTEAVKWLWSYCFENEKDPFFIWFFSHYYQAKNTLVGYEDDTLAVSLQLIPYNLYLRGRTIPISYVIGVATDPQMRSGGRSKELLRTAISEMRQRGHYASILMPFKAGFYYPYQWEICYHHYKYVLPLEDLETVSLPGGVFLPVRNGSNDCSDLQTAYQKFVQGRHGYVVRSLHEWKLAIDSLQAENGFCYLLMMDGVPEGYVMYTIDQNRIVVRELAYSCQLAQKRLFRFLYNHRSQAKQIEWNAPLDDTTAFALYDPKQDIRLFPFMTGRIVDVAQLLEAIEYPVNAEGTIIFRITDELASWNENVFILTVAHGKGEIRSGAQQTPDFHCAVGALTQLLFGRLSAFQLETMGRISSVNCKTLQLLNEFFPPCNNFINEYY